MMKSQYNVVKLVVPKTLAKSVLLLWPSLLWEGTSLVLITLGVTGGEPINLKTMTGVSRGSCSRGSFYLNLPFCLPVCHERTFQWLSFKAACQATCSQSWRPGELFGSVITRRQKAIKGWDSSPCTFSSPTVFELEFWSTAEGNALIFSIYLTVVQFVVVLLWGKTINRFLLKEN